MREGDRAARPAPRNGVYRMPSHKKSGPLSIIAVLRSPAVHALFALGALACAEGCGSAGTSTGSSTSALSAASTDDGGAPAVDVSACLTTYATCVRGGSDAATCGDALHAC